MIVCKLNKSTENEIKTILLHKTNFIKINTDVQRKEKQ